LFNIIKGESGNSPSMLSPAWNVRRIFVAEDLPAWSPAMRSKTTIRTSPKRHFVDPSIATTALRATPDSLLQDFNTFGLLFESLCIRDLRVYAEAIDGEVFHYRDRNGLEADAVVLLERWTLGCG
jgi:predicted AAA+ superfamily ATPase